MKDEDAVILVALVIMNIVETKHEISTITSDIEQYKTIVTTYIGTTGAISNNIDTFSTKSENVGTVDNPILVDGIKGIDTYIKSIPCIATETKHFKTSTLYLTDNETDINYAIDEYTIVDAITNTEIGKLWFNIYGTANCEYYPKEMVSEKEHENVFENESIAEPYANTNNSIYHVLSIDIHYFIYIMFKRFTVFPEKFCDYLKTAEEIVRLFMRTMYSWLLILFT